MLVKLTREKQCFPAKIIRNKKVMKVKKKMNFDSEEKGHRNKYVIMKEKS